MRRTKRIGDDRCGYVFIAPYYIFFVMFVLFPILVNIGLSFTDFNLKSISFVGVENYVTMISDSLFWISVKNTLIYVVFTVFYHGTGASAGTCAEKCGAVGDKVLQRDHIYAICDIHGGYVHGLAVDV